MKALLIIVTILLVITAAGSGYYITNLDGKIHDLKTELTGSIAQVNQDLTQNINQTTNQINQVDKTLSAQIQNSSQNLTAAINNSGASLNAYKATAEQQFAALQGADAASNGKINDLENKAADTKNQVDTLIGSILQSSALYDKVKTAIVQISDGTQLSGSGFIVSITSGPSTYKYVVTAYHVVKDMTAIYMTRYDGLTWKAAYFVGS
jgi:S1-C subfamily serine protease